MSDSVRPHRQQPTRLPRPWDSPGKNTGVSTLSPRSAQLSLQPGLNPSPPCTSYSPLSHQFCSLICKTDTVAQLAVFFSNWEGWLGKLDLRPNGLWEFSICEGPGELKEETRGRSPSGLGLSQKGEDKATWGPAGSSDRQALEVFSNAH